MTNFTAIILCDGFNEAMFPIERVSNLQIFEHNSLIKDSLFKANLLNILNTPQFDKIIIIARETDRFAISNSIKNLNTQNHNIKNIVHIYYKNSEYITPEMLLPACNVCDENIAIFFANKLIQNFNKLQKLLSKTTELTNSICLKSKSSFVDTILKKPKTTCGLLVRKIFLRELCSQKINLNQINSTIYNDFIIIEANNSERGESLFNIISNVQGVTRYYDIFNTSSINDFFKSAAKKIKQSCKNVFYAVNNKCSFINSSNLNIYSDTIQKKDIFCVGLKNISIIDCDDVLIVSNKKFNNAKVVEKLRESSADKIKFGSKVYRPWGFYEVLRDEPNYKVKTISVYGGGILSLQSHTKRAEHWVVTKGTATVVLNENTYLLRTGESIYIPLLAKHSLQNHGNELLQVIETQVGQYFGEDDITRYEDIYGRK